MNAYSRELQQLGGQSAMPILTRGEIVSHDIHKRRHRRPRTLLESRHSIDGGTIEFYVTLSQRGRS